MPFRSRLVSALTIILALSFQGAASGRTAPTNSGARPSTLAAAVAKTSGAPGWRTQSLADGRIAAIGVDTDASSTKVIGVACGPRKVPEVVVGTSGAQAEPKALLVETSDGIMAFPLAPAGDSALGIDALVAYPLLNDPLLTGDMFHIWLDDHPFSTAEARKAIEQVAKDCERRGWRYGNDHERQLIWMFTAPADEAPTLTFAKPRTGWLLAQITCAPPDGALLVKSTALPRRSKTGQMMPLTIHVGGHDFSTVGRAEMFEAGDVSGFLVGRFERPGPLLERLRVATRLSFRTKSEQLTIPARGVGALLPRFEKACNPAER